LPDHVFAKDPFNFWNRRTAGLGELVRDRVGVDDRGAQPLEFGRGGALAAADAAGQADHEAHPV